MPAIIQLPQVGESVTEGIIEKWLVKPGDRVEKYDPMVEISTDKVNMEVPAPFSGVILRLLVKEGDTVQMGKPIAELEIEGQIDEAVDVDEEPLDLVENFDREAERRARVGEFLEEVRSVGPTGSGEGGLGRPDVDTDTSVDSDSEALHKFDDSQPYERLSPLVRKMIEQYQLNPNEIEGSGRGGRVTKQDVMQHLHTSTQNTDSQPHLVHETYVQHENDAEKGIDRIELTSIRRRIAEHMATAATEIPSAWTMIEVDVSELVSWRNRVKDKFKSANSTSLSFSAIVGWLTAKVLAENPILNSTWGVDSIKQFKSINLGLAVSTESGLIVPVVHQADEINFVEFTTKVNQLITKARNATLDLSDVQGGTFTLNNTGALGSVLSVPIINYPQSAILTTEAIIKRPIVTESDAIAIRSMTNLCLSFDHRVCDGHDASIFLSSLKKILEQTDFSGIFN